MVGRGTRLRRPFGGVRIRSAPLPPPPAPRLPQCPFPSAPAEKETTGAREGDKRKEKEVMTIEDDDDDDNNDDNMPLTRVIKRRVQEKASEDLARALQEEEFGVGV